MQISASFRTPGWVATRLRGPPRPKLCPTDWIDPTLSLDRDPRPGNRLTAPAMPGSGRPFRGRFGSGWEPVVQDY